MADLKLKLGQEIDINKVDSSIDVAGSGGKIGRLVFSKGSVEWWPKGKHVNCVTFTWEDLAKVLETPGNGTPRKVPKTKKSSKVSSKAAPKSAAKPQAAVKSKSSKPAGEK